MDGNVRFVFDFELNREGVFCLVNHGSLLSVPQIFLYVTQVDLATWYRIPNNDYTNNPNTTITFPRMIRITLCSLSIYKVTPLTGTPNNLCIPNLIFHTNASLLSILGSELRFLIRANIVSFEVFTEDGYEVWRLLGCYVMWPT
jgi:hypothetical protein